MTSHVALLTGTDPAAVGVVRLRGPLIPDFVNSAIRFRGGASLNQLERGDIRRIELIDRDEPIDDGLISIHESAPNWDARIHLHGSPWILQRCIELAEARGFVRDSAVECDLWSANSCIERDVWAALSSMQTEAGVAWLMRQRLALPRALKSIFAELEPLAADPHPDESTLRKLGAACGGIAAGLRVFQAYARPTRVLLLGPPNSGKSTLANALAGREVAIVAPVAGTTRDWNEVPGEADGFPITWIDTAGVREARDVIEREGVRRALSLIATSDKVVIVFDATAPISGLATLLDDFANIADSSLSPDLIAINKSDLRTDAATLTQAIPEPLRAVSVRISAAAGTGLDTLRGALAMQIRRLQTHDAAAFTSNQAEVLSACERRIQNVNECLNLLAELLDGA